MKLLEMIVNNVKREDIPLNAKWFVQDRDGEIKSSSSNEKPVKPGNVWIRGHGRGGMKLKINCSSDWDFSIINREELMLAYDLVEQDYTLWFGGDCPVDEDLVVDVTLRCEEKMSISAGEHYWTHDFSVSDIIAYRINEKTGRSGASVGTSLLSSDEFIRLISSVAPNISVSDALEIANSLIDEGYHK